MKYTVTFQFLFHRQKYLFLEDRRDIEFDRTKTFGTETSIVASVYPWRISVDSLGISTQITKIIKNTQNTADTQNVRQQQRWLDPRRQGQDYG